jgi:competence protein ComEC
MKHFNIYIWKTSPFLRLLPPLIAGIIVQFYFPFRFIIIITSVVSFGLSYMLFSFLPIAFRFKLSWLQGFLINLLLISTGLLLLWQNDVRKSDAWFGKKYRQGDHLVIRINEPPIEKTKSFKAEGVVEAVIQDTQTFKTKGKILLYFSKDSSGNTLQYGDKIILNKPLQPIKNSGNPGAFNYERYAAFQQTFFNIFLKKSDLERLHETNVQPFNQFIFNTRGKILSILKNTIGDDRDQLGIAEALLIGYTNDLDKDLIQAYSNTGVVHIIAISGMHLGLIYIMLVWIFARTPVVNRSKFLQVILILGCLWIFSLLTGGAASVLRSAVMFTFITIGKSFGKLSPIYNSLAASAFVMLCYNPYYLWDVGFQLSYFAVVGIVIFQKPLYHLIYIKNKWLDKVWELMAVSLAAQIFTFPVCIYYFHQFPNLFLITNMIAVPLSSLILFAEIALVAISWIPWISLYAGKITAWLVWCMNETIIYINHISFSVWDKLPATVLSTCILYAAVIFTGIWFMKKIKMMFIYALSTLLFFTMVLVYGKWDSYQQQKIIVYNVPQHQAIDFIQGNHYRFVGDSILLADAMLQNFHLKPGRIALQLNNKLETNENVFCHYPFYQFNNKKILLLDRSFDFDSLSGKINIDLVIISKNPRIKLSELVKIFNCKKIVFDSSNSLWKIDKWQKECEELLLPCYSIPVNGAFILDTEA